jgi:hypothetical protein
MEPGAGTARHWIVAIIAAAIVLGGVIFFGGNPNETPPVPMATEAQTQ